MAASTLDPLVAQDQPQSVSAEPEQPTEPEAEAPEFGLNNEDLPESLQAKLMDLAKQFCDEDKFSRRIEIQESRRAHFFWRGMQHLYWDYRAEGWAVMGPAGAGLPVKQSYATDSAVLYVTNIYQAFGLSLAAVLTQNTPAVRFEPQNVNDPADTATAEAGDRFKKIVEHQNDVVMLMTEAAFFIYVDGRIHAWTRWAEDSRTGQSRETITLGGVLETKIPITAKSQDDFLYIQHSTEHHVLLMKEKHEKFADKIKGGAQGTGQDVYERTARISVKQGTAVLSQSGDTLTNLATEQNTWMRPAAFQKFDKEDADRAELQRIFPNGCRVQIISGVYTGSWNENMDDHWTVTNGLPGDGQFRNAAGSSILSVQERFNDIVNIAQDVYEKTQPARWGASDIVDKDGQAHVVSMPGAWYSAVKRPGEPLADSFFFEPPAQVSPDMLQYGQELMGPISQFLTGLFPALFGGPAKGAGGDTAAGYQMQQGSSMGRVGLIWRPLKRWWAKVMEQAIRVAAANRKDDMTAGVPDRSGKVETVSVRIEELRGEIFCYPETDENFPESWTQKRAVLMNLMSTIGQDPLVGKMLMEPHNLEQIQRIIGVEDFIVPGGDSAEKQMEEIADLLGGQPQPNPAYAALQEQKAQLMKTVQVMPVDDGQIMQLQQAMATTPQLVPSVQIDPQCDDHQAEAETGLSWMRSPQGRKQKQSNPTGFMNVRLHILAHQDQAKQQAAQQAAQMAAMATARRPVPAPAAQAAP